MHHTKFTKCTRKYLRSPVRLPRKCKKAVKLYECVQTGQNRLLRCSLWGMTSDFFCIWGPSFPWHLFLIKRGLQRLPDGYARPHVRPAKCLVLPFAFFFLGSRKQQTKESEEFWMPASKPGGLPMSRGSYVLASIAAASLSPGKSARAATCTHSHSCTTVYGPSPLNQQSKCFPYTYNNFLFLPVNLDTE